MEKLFKKVKEAFPNSVIQYEKNYVSFTFGGGLYYQLRVQKDKVRMMATNYPTKAKLGECLKIIKKENIEGSRINNKEVIFEVGVRNPEIFTLRLEMPYVGNQLNDESFLNDVVDSSAKFHEVILPVVNNFLKQPAGDLYSLMGGSTPFNSGSSNAANNGQPTSHLLAVQKDEENKNQNKKTVKNKNKNQTKQREIKYDITSKNVKLNDKSTKNRGESKQDKIDAEKGMSDFEKMIKAFKDGDFDRVADFIEKGNLPLQWNNDVLIEVELINIIAQTDGVDLKRLQHIINKGIDLNERNKDADGYTAVHFAAWDGKDDALKMLLKAGADPDIVGLDGRTALHLATAMGYSDTVKILIGVGVDIDRRIPEGNKYYSKNGATALREALINQQWEVIELLVDEGAVLSSLKEPCLESYKGKSNLFDVIRSLEEDGEYSEGNFDKEKLDELEAIVNGAAPNQAHTQGAYSIIQIGEKVNSSMFKKSANLRFWLGDHKEKYIKDIFYSEDNEKYIVLTADKNGKKIDYWDMEAINTQLSDKYRFEYHIDGSNDIEEEFIEENFEFDLADKELGNNFNEDSDLSDFNVEDNKTINFISNNIKKGKYLSSLLYVNKALSAKGFEIDKHQTYFFDSNVLISDRELEGFLVVNMDGFYSNCMNEDEMSPIFSWSGVNDIEYSENKKWSSIDIIADNGRLTIRKEGSKSLKILYTFYQYVWRPIDERFKNESTILWNEVWDMGINEIGFEAPVDYFTFKMSNASVDDIENEAEENDNVFSDQDNLDIIEEDEYEELEEEEYDVDNEIGEDPYSYNIDLQDFGFVNKKKYKPFFDRFLMLNENTGILSSRFTREPDDKERNELWNIARIFCERIYQLDKDENADQHEINVLSHFTIVALNWCFINQSDSRFNYSNGRFRRDTLALALCIFSRISRDYKKYDFLKNGWINPHIKFSYLMWSIRTIIDANEDNVFYKYSVQEAKNAFDTFIKIDRENQKKGQSGYVEFQDLPDSNPLKKIGNELTRLLKNNLIPYQFILNYIWEKPKESFFKKLLGSANRRTSNERVRLLDSDLEKNKEYLMIQIKHKEFPQDWTFANDLAFVYSYFAKITDGLFSDEEQEVIIEKLSEWMNEEDKKGTEKIKTNQKFKLAFAEFERDPHIERFRFALENLRRHFYIHFDGNEQKILAQLRNVMKDLYVIAESDSGKNEYAISDEERALLDEIDELWGTAS